MIIYRDLKPHNVLLFNLKTDAEFIAKITDYGIAQYCCSMGVRSSEGTPGFRAPEVARGNVIYNVQADVFSFGLLLYDLLTYGERISDGMKFPSEFDEVAVQGKLPDPVKDYGCSPWPGFEFLMRECLRENPQDRPTSTQVLDRLNSAEMLCVMRELTLMSLAGECFTVSSADGGKTARVWIGGGSSSQKMGCVTSLDLETGESLNQEIDSSPVLCMVIVRAPGSCDDWLVAGTQSGSLFIMDTMNAEVLHCLKSVNDSVTSLFFHTDQHRCLKNYLLVGTANGTLVIYEDSVLKVKNGGPVKTLQVGDVNAPLMCIGPSNHPQERKTLWAACGTKVICLTVDYNVYSSIDTKPKQILPQLGRVSRDACISRLAVDKHVFVSKTGSHTVEVWDKKTGRMVNLIDCMQLLGLSSTKKPKAQDEDQSGHEVPCLAIVKALLVQHSGTLWIGTKSGRMLLVEVSSCQLLQTFSPRCDSIRCMGSVMLDRKNVVLVLGRRQRMPQDQIKTQLAEDSVLTVWSSSLPLEVRDLTRHCELRDKITSKMRETLHS
ncbi:leucine-rich repeat serine/threonine-protein kinase 2-like isoform X2 [Pimephales promelas]|uniref:leucine-rich repeat serine/threonine-protein kinase 2-like isoform X2 n=1 Tax=Pimephales promelas TaxID=90988 RepID=UPI0019555F20|nr:leucine-rich repeat serine/threonine-protein kinase 2-like isoform X2 [Pimephales promelas]